jgi:hypothetical protein
LTKIKFIHFEKATELEEIPHSQYGQSKSEKSEELVTITTTASKSIPKRLRISIN